MKKSILFLGLISAISFTTTAQEQKTTNTETTSTETTNTETPGTEPIITEKTNAPLLAPAPVKTGYEEEILKAEKAKQKAEADAKKAAEKMEKAAKDKADAEAKAAQKELKAQYIKLILPDEIYQKYHKAKQTLQLTPKVQLQPSENRLCSDFQTVRPI